MENNNTSLVLQELNNNVQTLAKIALINLPDGTPMRVAERLVLKELTNFEMACIMRPELADPNIDRNSILIAVKQAILDNLTLNPNAGLVHLIPGKIKVGQNGNTDIYKLVLKYSPTADGELSIARQSGSILDHKHPIVKFDSNGDVSEVHFEFLKNSKPEPRWEKKIFTKEFFNKLKIKSAIKNKGDASVNYSNWNQKRNENGVLVGTIDPEFACTKAIKHGLKRLGTNANEVQRTSEHSVMLKEDTLIIKDVNETLETSGHLTERIETIKKDAGITDNHIHHNDNHIQDVNFEEVPAQPQTQQTQLDLPSNNDLF